MRWEGNGSLPAQERRALLRGRAARGIAARSAPQSTSIQPRPCAAMPRRSARRSTAEDPLIAYAVKANPNAAVLATLAKAGLGADVVSGGEYRARDRCRRCLATRSSSRALARPRRRCASRSMAASTSSTSNPSPRRRCFPPVASSMGRTAPVGFRVNPDVVAGTHAKISTGAAENKFGIAIGEATAAYARAAELPGLAAPGRRRPHRQPAHQPRPARTRVQPDRRADRRSSGPRVRTFGRRPWRRSRRALRPRPPAAAEPCRLWRDGPPDHARLECAAGLRAWSADRRQRRSAALARHPDQAGQQRTRSSSSMRR